MSFSCNNNIISNPDDDGYLRLIYPCIPDDTALGDPNIYNLKFISVSIPGPPTAISIIRIIPINFDPDAPPSGNGLSLSFHADSSTNQITQVSVRNGRVVSNVNGVLTIQMTRNGVDLPIVYIFRPFVQQPFSTITINSLSFNLVQNDDIIDGPGNNSPPINNCDLSNLPIVNINYIRTDQLGQNNADYVFSVIDTFKYDGYYCDSENICPGKKIYQTYFSEFPQIQTVLKGNVCDCDPTRGTLVQKVHYLVDKFDIPFSFENSYYLISFYAGARYILSKLLYGKFSVKFLLGRYYDKFLCHLANSRFNNFLQLFTEPQTVMLDNIPTVVDFSVFANYFFFDLHFNNVNHNIQGNTRGCYINISSGHT